MEELRKFFTFNKGERVAILTILAIIIILLLFCLFRPTRKSLSDSALHNLDSLLALKRQAVEAQQQKEKGQEIAELHPFPFNPNTLTEEEWKQMGLTDRQVRNIMNYKAKGGKFYTKNDLGKLYSISEEDFAQLEPFIVLPDVSRGNKPKTSSKKTDNQPVSEETQPREKKAIPIVDLNTVDSVTLVELPQIGPYTAVRIIEFREKLGGFVDKEQLREVKGMDSVRFATIEPYINLGEAETRKIDINRADFKTLVNHPYLNYEQVKRIFNQREKRGMIKNWAQLQSLLKEEGEVNPLLEYYVKY